MSQPAHHNSTPWIPTESFFAQNTASLQHVGELLVEDFPGQGAEALLSIDGDGPTSEQFAFMWPRLMGHQHGILEGSGGKLIPPAHRTDDYRDAFRHIRYGEHSIHDAIAPPVGQIATKAFVVGGTPEHLVVRLKAALNNDPHAYNADETIMLAGQRVLWDIPSERNVTGIYQAIARASGRNMDDVRARLPLMDTEEQKSGTGWDQPFSSETELARLAVEAVLLDQIDWKNGGVTTTIDETARPQVFDTVDGPYEVPARADALITYHLVDGRKVHVLNAKAISRTRPGQPAARPRPNTDSQLKEAAELLNWTDDERVVLAIHAPFLRAGLDGIIRLEQALAAPLNRADVVTGPWVEEPSSVSYALGEIPALAKADRRRRAQLAGQDPDTPALLAL